MVAEAPQELAAHGQPRLYLVRHASPDWERRDLPYDRPPGPPLSSLGREEAARLGEFLRHLGVRRLWVSPMLRCVQTAEIVAPLLGVDWQIEAGLIEWRAEEDLQETGQRLWMVWERARQESSRNGPLALLTHGSPIRYLLSRLGLSDEALLRHSFDHGNPLPPAGVWRAQLAAEPERWELELVFQP